VTQQAEPVPRVVKGSISPSSLLLVRQYGGMDPISSSRSLPSSPGCCVDAFVPPSPRVAATSNERMNLSSVASC